MWPNLVAAFVIIWLCTAGVQSASARTVLLDATACDRIAAISEAAPRHSWAMYERTAGVFETSRVQLARGRSLLVRFPLDVVPARQRIAHAELIVPLNDFAGNEPRFYLWRLTAGWGPGVSHLYRQTVDRQVPWTRAGARGDSSDRATRPTHIERLAERKEVSINVTEDVALWYSRLAPNEGWMLSVEDPEVFVYMASPLGDSRTAWKLRITYEPQ